MKRSTVAIVGRPNVGKSTLFNRIIGRRQAIVDDAPGVTRDRNTADTEWTGISFTLVDTGGFIPSAKKEMEHSVNRQVNLSIEEADVILLLVDQQTGITDMDQRFARLLQRGELPVIPVVNKVDGREQEAGASEFHKLGLGEPSMVSARDGRAIGDMLDRVVDALSHLKPASDEEEPEIRIAIVGRPNVGKSSTVNAILNLPRMIVSNVPGTTRDAVDTRFRFKHHNLRIVDTAGLRKRTKQKEAVEYYSNLRAYDSIDRCDVAIVLVDAESGLEAQDKKILEYCADNRKGLIVALNKWDLIEKDHKTYKEFELDTRDELKRMQYVEFLAVSALTRQRINKLLDRCIQIYEERGKRVPTKDLIEMILEATKLTPPPTIYGKKATIKFCEQVATAPPVFLFFVSNQKGLPETYRRFLENRIRENFGFAGVPLTMRYKTTKSSKE
jgi:GTPase